MAQDVLSNGFVRLCIDPSLNFYDGKCRALFIGQALEPSDGSDPVYGQVTQVDSVRDLPGLFGRGSILSEAMRLAFCTCPGNVQFFAIGLEDPAAGVASVYTTTITGPATSDGRFTLFLGNSTDTSDYSIDIEVRSGDTVAEIAAAVVAAVGPDFPYTAAVISTGVTWTAKNKGLVGNFLNPIYNWAGRKNYAPAGVTVTTTRTTAGAGSPVPVDLISALQECCYSTIAYLGPDTPMQNALDDYLKDVWSCDKPQCFGEGFVYNAGTLGEVLAAGNNSQMQRLAYSLDAFDFPWMTLTNYAALTACSACENPELSIQGGDNGLLGCVAIPQTCGSAWTFDERIQLQAQGFVTYGPSANGAGELTNPQIYNDVTNKLYDNLGRPNATSRDAVSIRLQQSTAIAIATQFAAYNGLALFTKNTKINQGVKGTNPRLILADIRTWAKSQVGTLFSEFDNIDTDIVVQTDMDIAPKCQGLPELLHCNFRYRQPVRIGQIKTNLQPQLFDNCDR